MELGEWVMVRRSELRRGRLDAARIAELDALPGWTWDPYADDWERALDTLRVFVAREGHTRIPADSVEAGIQLGSWVGRQRLAYRAGNLALARAAELEAIPGWSWGRSSSS